MNGMELLEQRIRILVEKVQQERAFFDSLQQEVVALRAENAQLREQNKCLEENILLGNRSLEEMHQEKELTSFFADELIKTVDSIISESK
ncbi:MAG: hypothetical protein UU47_C0003G0062 [candidate division TM6 bacterium GW2011_GWE2_41_16]|nr:MAG: hypothetical protein UU47_C0003G0062 [candidate division TM6 bacterium GW2011_GWE2_41_16]